MPVSFEQTTRSLGADRGRGGLWVLLAGVVVLAGWGAWFGWAEVAVYVPAGPGRVEVVEAVVPVQVEVGGRLVESRLVLGGVVAAGEVLARLDDRETRLVMEEEVARRGALVGRLGALQGEIAARAAAVGPGGAADLAGGAEVRARLAAARAEAGVAVAEARRVAAVAGVVSVAEVARLAGEAARAEAVVDELRQQARRVEAEGALRAAEREAVLVSLRGEVVAVEGEIAQVDARLARLRRSVELMVVRAPAAGRVVAVEPRGVGSVLAVGEVLGRVMGDGGLRIVAVFPVEGALGRVRVGQRARVRFDGFSWTRFGAVSARVSAVAGEGSGVGSGGGGLRVELVVDSGVGAAPHEVPLQHGLTGQVEVEVERVAPVELVLAALGRVISGATSGGEGGR